LSGSSCSGSARNRYVVRAGGSHKNLAAVTAARAHDAQRSFEMKKNTSFVMVMAAVLLTFGLVLAACGKNSSGGGGGGSAGSSKSSGRGTPANDFSYDATEEGTGVVITKYTGNGGKVVVPAKIEGLPVVEIKDNVFARKRIIGYYSFGSANADKITELVIPDSVVLIGHDLCLSAQSLTKVTLPGGLKEIPSGAFDHCENLTRINLPASLESIGSGAFLGCKNLVTANLPASLKSINSSAFSGCGELANLAIPNSLGKVTVGNDAFSGCGKLPLAVRAKIKALGYTGSF
jgi:hypothetical protein